MATAIQTPIKLFAFDVDGVLTDGKLYYSPTGEQSGLKVFHAHDGMGLSLLKTSGVILVAISGRNSPATRCRLEELGVNHIFLDNKDKWATLSSLADTLGILPKQCTFMGDDLIDIEAMRNCGFAIAPSNAVKQAKEVASFITKSEGGNGAVREASERILDINGSNINGLIASHLNQ